MDTQPTANCCPKCLTPLPPDAPQGLCPKCLFAAVATPTEADQPAGHRPAPPALTEIAAAFPQLEILEFIGQGGMGFVFKARQPKLDRLVALKILPQSLAADPTFAERFNREARLLARLNHPGIVAVHDFGVAIGRADLPVRQGNEAVQQHQATSQFYYLLMEFVDGVNLRQAMQAGRFTPGQALAIVPKICEALQFAHNERILHRDIKPENILLDAKGRVKIADFGIAKLVGDVGQAFQPAGAGDFPVASSKTESSSEAKNTGLDSPANRQAGKPALQPDALTEAGKTLGSPNYMAPEQLEHPGEVDHRADIYSLGVVFYEMLTGELPLGRFAPPSQKSAADPRVDEVVLRALEKERERRQHSAGEVKTQVETISSDSSRREEAHSEKSGIGNRKSEMSPRFSRMAIVGAMWLALFFAVVPAFLWHENATREPIRLYYLTWIIIVFAFLLPGFTAPFGSTILGWIAVAQIRRSAGKLHGLWLAVFDGLLFPLLALDVAIVGSVIIVLRLLDQLLHHSMVAPILGSVLLLAPVVFGIIALADFLIIRRVWRAVKRPVGAPAPLVQKPDRFWRWFVVTTLAMILVIFSIAILGLLAAIAIPNFVKARAQSQANAQRAAAPTSADFHWRVFEADAALVDRLIPAGQRQHGVQSTAKAYLKYSGGGGSREVNNGTNSFKVTMSKGPEIDSWVANISPETLNALLYGIGNKTNILADGTQTISGVWWPTGMPTIWNYSRQDGVFYRGGGGAIYLAIRQLDGHNEIRVEGEVHHQTDLNEIAGITSMFLYEGKTPQNGALAFLVPFFRKDDSEHYLVAVYEVGNTASTTTSTAAPQNISFGPVMERVLPDQLGGQGPFMNFESGELVVAPNSLVENRFDRTLLIDWLVKAGADASAIAGENGGHQLVSYTRDTCFSEVSPSSWERMNESGLLLAWQLAARTNKIVLGNPELLPRTFVFETRTGIHGLLQFTGFTENPRGVKLRYKLVQNSASTNSQ